MRAQPSLRSGPLFAGQRIGLLGGSFNPAHAGHRFISLYALKTLGLDAVWWLVSPQNPLKDSRETAALDERVTAAQAVARHPRIVVTALETALGTRYTVDTLARLTQRFPRCRFVWLMGADNLAQMPHWRRWTQIYRLVPIAVFGRPTYSLGALRGHAAQRFARQRAGGHRVRGLAGRKTPAWVFLRNPLHPASSTAIRRARAPASDNPAP